MALSVSEIGVWAAFILTLMVYTYLIADNFLYRAAVYIFAGLTAGFSILVIWQSVMTPWFNDLQQVDNVIDLTIDLLPLIFVLSLAINPKPNIQGLPVLSRFLRFLLLAVAGLRRIVLAFLIGVGAAVTLVGVTSGTLLPLTVSVGRSPALGMVSGAITIIGTISVLIYFQYAANRKDDGTTERPNILAKLFGGVGGYVIAVTMGAIYAGAIATSLVVFSERIAFLVERMTSIFGG